MVPSFTGLKLNVFAIMIGPSRLGFKTQPLDNILIPLIRHIKRDLPQWFTVEGLTEYLNEIDPKEGLIVRDELSTLFKEPKYNSQLLEFLSKLYSGSPHSRYTKGDKLVDVPGNTISMIGATTPYLYSLMKSETFIQGFGNRVLWIVSTGSEVEVDKDLLFPSRQTINHKELDLKKYKNFLKRLTSERPQWDNVWLSITNDAEQILHKYFNDKRSSSLITYKNSQTDLRSTYEASCGEFAIKLAGLYAVGELYKEPYTTPILDLNCAKWGISRAELHLKHFDQLLLDWRSRPIEKMDVTDDISLNKLLEIIKKYADDEGYFPNQKVFRATKWGWPRYADKRLTLIKRGDIVITNDTEKPRYKLHNGALDLTIIEAKE